MRRAVALDLDGTLLSLPVDIEPARAEVGRLLTAAGHPGRPAPILAAIAAARDPSVRRAAYAALDRAELSAAPRAVARPGARRLLAAIAGAGLPLAIVTDNGRACVAPALASAGLRCRYTLVARDDLARAKPAPDGVVAAARALLPGGGAMLWAGDSARDVAAGLAARPLLPGVRLTIAAIGAGHTGADRIAHDLAALTAWLVG